MLNLLCFPHTAGVLMLTGRKSLSHTQNNNNKSQTIAKKLPQCSNRRESRSFSFQFFLLYWFKNGAYLISNKNSEFKELSLKESLCDSLQCCCGCDRMTLLQYGSHKWRRSRRSGAERHLESIIIRFNRLASNRAHGISSSSSPPQHGWQTSPYSFLSYPEPCLGVCLLRWSCVASWLNKKQQFKNSSLPEDIWNLCDFSH